MLFLFDVFLWDTKRDILKVFLVVSFHVITVNTTRAFTLQKGKTQYQNIIKAVHVNSYEDAISFDTRSNNDRFANKSFFETSQ